MKFQPRENYKVLIDHYREEYERHGHDPRHQYLGSGSGAGGVFIADTTQEAKRQFGPVYEALTHCRANHAVEVADPFGGRPEFAGAASPDAAGTVTADHASYRRNHAYAH